MDSGADYIPRRSRHARWLTDPSIVSEPGLVKVTPEKGTLDQWTPHANSKESMEQGCDPVLQSAAPQIVEIQLPNEKDGSGELSQNPPMLGGLNPKRQS